MRGDHLRRSAEGVLGGSTSIDDLGVEMIDRRGSHDPETLYTALSELIRAGLVHWGVGNVELVDPANCLG